MEIRTITDAADLERAFVIRRVVFVEEQACPPEEEFDGYDEEARQLLGITDGEPVATARWRVVDHEGARYAKLERFAVLEEHRSRGLGRKMVEAAMEAARDEDFRRFILHAQAHLVDFYRSFGFTSTGRRFMEAGIPHVEMVKSEEGE